MNKRILQLAVPSIISNITVPLLGLVDVAIVGHIGDAAYIGAIAVGSMLFNVIYWLFGFLRMGTSGMTSQALGRRDLPEVMRLLIRSLGIGVGIGLLFFILQRCSSDADCGRCRRKQMWWSWLADTAMSASGEHRRYSDSMDSPAGLSVCRIPVFRWWCL